MIIVVAICLLFVARKDEFKAMTDASGQSRRERHLLNIYFLNVSLSSAS